MDFKQIEQYFRRGLSNREILALLKEVHGIKISNRTLERILSKHQLWRRKNKTDEADVVAFIQQQLQTSGQSHGYRWMHQKCWLNGIITDRETVRVILRLLDGEGVDLRSRNRLRRRVYFSRGPNYVWHIDGYDKLKPYGIGISGCIDGFSRKIMWLEAYRTNNDPRVIAGYFMTAVIEAEGCPNLVRLDLGTENVNVAEMQKFLHHGTQSDSTCVSFGPSTSNQRIERWWLTLRSQCIQFWMNLFDNLKEDGHYADTFLDKCLILFCFQNLIQVSHVLFCSTEFKCIMSVQTC
ncbi:Methylglyoxal synthase [Labeo rohita]|uniref:Methylglyoxal synthase n=1 Tax=Labeo rohita TaxID=84645 RepID=A0ABQ8L7X6_LABRO|nr:Methylglyoxal synthase [Labeo rohita]